eukprot:SAG31_NODE_1193_length_9454_cov_38.779156_10_plen_72_part_00
MEVTDPIYSECSLCRPIKYVYTRTYGVIHWLNNSLVLAYIQVQPCTRATTTGEGHATVLKVNAESMAVRIH